MRIGRIRVIGAIAFTALGVAAQPQGSSGYCQPGLLSAAPKNPEGYAGRNAPARCEGLLRFQYAGRIYLSGLARGTAAKVKPHPESLTVVWQGSPGQLPAGAAESLRIEVTGRKSDSYYRMDTAVEARVGRFDWPAEIAAALNFTPEQLDVLAKTRSPGELANLNRELMVPASIANLDGRSASDGYLFATFWSDAIVERIAVDSFAVNEKGQVFGPNEAVTYCKSADSNAGSVAAGCSSGSWPDRSRIRVPVAIPPGAPKHGFLRVEIRALKSEGTVVGSEAILVDLRRP